VELARFIGSEGFDAGWPLSFTAPAAKLARPMDVVPTRLEGPLLLQPQVLGDHRGFFAETYREDEWRALGIDAAFVQDNHSRSRRGTLRGIHFQLRPGQAKLVRCARGSILDVIVDLRRGSPRSRTRCPSATERPAQRSAEPLRLRSFSPRSPKTCTTA
jgi:hypothetical protein